MFLGGAGLADTILYCRHKIYPLGLPNWAAHSLTFLLGLISVIVGRRSRAAAGAMGAAQGLASPGAARCRAASPS